MRQCGVLAGYGYWVGTGEGYTGVLPTDPAPREEPQTDSGAGPGSPAGAGVGGQAGTVPLYVRTHPFGARSGHCPSLVLLEHIAASGPIRARFQVISEILVKMTKCHQNMSIRPLIVPISRTASRIHLLEFSDFHFRQPSPARN